MTTLERPPRNDLLSPTLDRLGRWLAPPADLRVVADAAAREAAARAGYRTIGGPGPVDGVVVTDPAVGPGFGLDRLVAGLRPGGLVALGGRLPAVGGPGLPDLPGLCQGPGLEPLLLEDLGEGRFVFVLGSRLGRRRNRS